MIYSNKNILYIPLIIICLLASCKSQKNTFMQVYERDMPDNASELASMKSDGSYIFAMEEEPQGFGSAKGFVIDGATGDPLWEEKRNDLTPSHWLWEDNIMIVFEGRGKNGVLKGKDLKTSEVKWSVSAEDYNRRWEEDKLKFVPKEDAFLLPTKKGLTLFNYNTGAEIWNRGDLLTEYSAKDVNDFIYFPEEHRLFVADKEQLHEIDLKNGESRWTMNNTKIGSLHNADMFPTNGLAVFYGEQDESFGKQLLKSVARSTEVGNAAMDAVEGGLVKDQMILVDLDEGEVIHENDFYTNGNHQTFIYEDKLIMMGIVINVFDLETGELMWQNIDQRRFENEFLLKAIGSLTGLDFSLGNKRKQEDLIFDNNIYAFYPEALDDPLKQNQVTLRKYDLTTGEEIWRSEAEKINASYYTGAEGVLLMVGTTTGFVPRSLILAYDAASGEKLYELKINATRLIDIKATQGRLYTLLWPHDIEAFNLRTGQEISLKTPARQPTSMRMVQNDLMITYGSPTMLALHDAKDFSVKNSVELPDLFYDFDYRGGKFFMYNMDGFEGARGIVALDLEKWIVIGYLINDQQGTFTSTVGDGDAENQIYKDYHLFLTDDGDYIYELEKDVIKKYAVKRAE